MDTVAERLCTTILRKTKGPKEERHPVWDPQWFKDNMETILEQEIQRYEEELIQMAHEEKEKDDKKGGTEEQEQTEAEG